MDQEKLYRRRRADGFHFDPITSDELASSLTTIQASDKREPDHPQLPEGEWYCPNENCVVREVHIHATLLDGEKLPEISCPACKRWMMFHHWLHYETLVEVKS